MTDKAELKAEVKIGKLKDCPMLTAGKIDPIIFQTWNLPCKRYMKHAGKQPEEIVSFVAEAMMEPRLISWYQAQQTRIDKLMLTKYMEELVSLVLEKDWDHKIRIQVLSSKQGDRHFMDWAIEMENLNAILRTSAATRALTDDALKNQLEANLNPELQRNLGAEAVLATTLAPWMLEVKERDERLQLERARVQRMIDANNLVRSTRCAERRTPQPQPIKYPTNRGSPANAVRPPTSRFLPKLTPAERSLLDEHQGCTRCRTFYAGHCANECPMKTTNSWPDPEAYQQLTSNHGPSSCTAHSCWVRERGTRRGYRFVRPNLGSSPLHHATSICRDRSLRTCRRRVPAQH
ncbi:MAG TPA: hypothetical protein VGO47_10405 [Chlamydiales bacterium]|nr:hypothetical protein [Chlamydiales bacterium]